MAEQDLTKEKNSVDVSRPGSQSRIQCADIKLVSSLLRPLDKEKDKAQKESRFIFKIKAYVRENIALSYLDTQVVFVSSVEGEQLGGYWLRFSLLATFITNDDIKPEELGNFAKMYTLSILWPYAREYTGDQFRRVGASFDVLPIINPQVITEHMVNTGLIDVEIIQSNETQVNQKENI